MLPQRRMGLNEIRAWHESKRDARRIAASGGLDISTIMGYWGRVAWRAHRARCVYARARRREDARWDAFRAEVAADQVSQ